MHTRCGAPSCGAQAVQTHSIVMPHSAPLIAYCSSLIALRSVEVALGLLLLELTHVASSEKILPLQVAIFSGLLQLVA